MLSSSAPWLTPKCMLGLCSSFIFGLPCRHVLFFFFTSLPTFFFFFYVCASTDSSVYVNESSVLFVPAVQWQHFHKNKKLPSLQSVCLAEDCQKDRLGLSFFFTLIQRLWLRQLF